jgi:hypothetical protein
MPLRQVTTVKTRKGRSGMAALTRARESLDLEVKPNQPEPALTQSRLTRARAGPTAVRSLSLPTSMRQIGRFAQQCSSIAYSPRVLWTISTAEGTCLDRIAPERLKAKESGAL